MCVCCENVTNNSATLLGRGPNSKYESESSSLGYEPLNAPSFRPLVFLWAAEKCAHLLLVSIRCILHSPPAAGGLQQPWQTLHDLVSATNQSLMVDIGRQIHEFHGVILAWQTFVRAKKSNTETPCRCPRCQITLVTSISPS